LRNRPLYLSPTLSTDLAGCNQHERALVEEFALHGYVVIDLEDPDFDQLAKQTIADLAPVYTGEQKHRHAAVLPGRIQDAARHFAGPKRIAANAKILATLELLHGRKPFPFQTLNFNRGTEQATHSDSVHFDSWPHGFMAGVWVALEDIDANNGPLHYYPGSHKLPHLTLADVGVRGSDVQLGDYSLYEEHYVPAIAEIIKQHGLKPEEAHLRRGQALIWSANLLHGGNPIREKGRSRHSQVTHYYFENTAYFTPLYSDPILGKVLRRFPRNLMTGKSVRPSYFGQPIVNPLWPRIRNRAANIARSVF
jgi:ectoine hydroxylase-related dioxygenase (phytanoyl-CoA dioxygenase family)